MVRADPECLRKVLEHLVSNALKFTPAGGSVQIDVERAGDSLFDIPTRIHVSDSGIGILPEAKATIFEPFVLLDDSLTRRTGGTGLGLAMVKELTVAMGGSVSVESEPGVGSTFTVTLPSASAVQIVA
jgi:signal transduction histidine kinase